MQLLLASPLQKGERGGFLERKALLKYGGLKNEEATVRKKNLEDNKDYATIQRFKYQTRSQVTKENDPCGEKDLV